MPLQQSISQPERFVVVTWRGGILAFGGLPALASAPVVQEVQRGRS